MKKISMFFAALCLSAMAMAVEPKAVIDFSDSTNVWGFPTALSKDTATYTSGGQTVKMYPSASIAQDQGYKLTRVAATDSTDAYSYLIFGKKNYKIELPTFGFAVGKIMVYGTTKASPSVEVNVFVGETAVSTKQVGAKLPDQLPTFVIASNYRAAGNQYAIKVMSTHNMQITKIEVYEEVAGAPENPVFSPKEGIFSSAQNVTLSCATDGATIQYSYDGSTYLDYSAPLQVESTQTIYAKAVKSQIESDVVTATYVIVSTEGDGTKENPYTIADLAILNNPGDTAWVGGYIIGCANSSGNLMADSVNNNNVLIGDSVTATKGAPIKLSTKDLKADVGLVDHPERVGKFLKVYGAMIKYCGKPGVQNISDYVIESASALVTTKQEGAMVKKMMMNGQVVLFKDGKYFNLLGTEL